MVFLVAGPKPGIFAGFRGNARELVIRRLAWLWSVLLALFIFALPYGAARAGAASATAAGIAWLLEKLRNAKADPETA
jgi:hypothetical protein